jgi:hypothetical protein
VTNADFVLWRSIEFVDRLAADRLVVFAAIVLFGLGFNIYQTIRQQRQ